MSTQNNIPFSRVNGESKLVALNGLKTDLSHVLSSYVDLGVSVLPLDPKTLDPLWWDPIPDDETALKIEEKFPDCIVGFRTGEKLIAIECASDEANKKFRTICEELGFDPDFTSMVEAKHAYAYLFANSAGKKIITEKYEDICIRGENSFTIGAPARTADTIYTLHDFGLVELPIGLIEGIRGEDMAIFKAPHKSCEHDDSPSSLDLALKYADRGIPVFPVNPANKKPYTGKWLNGENFGATTDLATIKKYFGKHPTAMVGGAMGEKSGYVIVDCDKDHGEDGEANYKELCAKNNHDPDKTAVVLTPSGGLHYIYKYPKGEDIGISASKLAPAVDTRANGGYVVLAGSTTAPDAEFPNKTYKVINDVTPLECPQFLVELLKRPGKNEEITGYDPKSDGLCQVATPKGRLALNTWARKVAESPEGNRNDTLNSACYHLGLWIRNREISEELVRETMINAGLECGLSEDEVRGVVNRATEDGKNSAEPIRHDFSKIQHSGQSICKTGIDAVPIANQVTRQRSYGEVTAPSGKKAFTPGLLTRYALRGGITDMNKLAERILPPNAYGIVRRYSEYNEIPIETVICVMISLISGAIGGREIMRISDGIHIPANTYALLVGEIYSRKSAIMDFFHKPLKDLNEQWEEEYNEEMRKYKREEQEWSKKKEGDPPVKPIKKESYVHDATIESVIGVLSRNPYGLLWQEDEGNKWIQRLCRYNKDSIGDVTSKLIHGFNGATIKVNRQPKDRKDNDLLVKRAFLSIFVNLQTDLLPVFFTYEDKAQGLMQRFLFIHIPSKAPGTRTQIKRRSDPYDKSDADLLKTIVQKLIDLPSLSERRYIDITDDAFDWAQAESKKMEEALAYGSNCFQVLRLNDIIYRFALILHYLHWADSEESSKQRPDTHITKDDFERAFDLGRFYLMHLDKILWLLGKPRELEGKQLDPQLRAFARFVIDNSEFFNEYRTVEEIERHGFNVGDRHKFGKMLKEEGFPNEKKKGKPGKYLLHGLLPWKDVPGLLNNISDDDPAKPYAEAILAHADVIIKNGHSATKADLAEWFDSTVQDLAQDDEFLPAMARLGGTDQGDRISFNADFLTMVQKCCSQSQQDY